MRIEIEGYILRAAPVQPQRPLYIVQPNQLPYKLVPVTKMVQQPQQQNMLADSNGRLQALVLPEGYQPVPQQQQPILVPQQSFMQPQPFYQFQQPFVPYQQPVQQFQPPDQLMSQNSQMLSSLVTEMMTTGETDEIKNEVVRESKLETDAMAPLPEASTIEPLTPEVLLVLPNDRPQPEFVFLKPAPF